MSEAETDEHRLWKAKEAYRFFIDATNEELADCKISRLGALDKARQLDNAIEFTYCRGRDPRCTIPGFANLLLLRLAAESDSLKWEITSDDDTYQTIFDGHVVRICGDTLTIVDDGLAKVSQKVAEKLAKDKPQLTLRMTADEFPEGPKFTIERTLPVSGEKIVAKLEAWLDAKCAADSVTEDMEDDSETLAPEQKRKNRARAALVDELDRVVTAIAGVRR